METLSSCYFCSTALDASLDEYPVVPDALGPSADDQQTVVLCDTCARKLDAVLESIVAAVENGSAASTPRESSSESAASGNSPDAGSREATEPRSESTGDVSELEETLGDDEDVLQPVADDSEEDGFEYPADEEDATSDTSAEESDAEEDDDGDETNETEADDEKPRYSSSRGAGFTRDHEPRTNRGLTDSSDEKKYSDSRGAGFRRDDSGDRSGLRDSDEADASDESDDSEAEETESESDSESVPDSEEKKKRYTDGRRAGFTRDDESGSTNRTSNGTGGSDSSSSSGSSDEGSSPSDSVSSASDSASSASDSSSSDGDSGGSSKSAGDTPDVSMSRLENTKVMRLLENREFPVDKEEFVTVAANAYQISRQDCEKVLGLAVQHGLIHEEDGQLVGGEL